MVAAGLVSLRNGAQAASEAMLSAKARMRPALDANLSILATIGSNAPFVGLLGTVLGIIKAAHEMNVGARAEQSQRRDERRVRGAGGDGGRTVRGDSGGGGLQPVRAQGPHAARPGRFARPPGAGQSADRRAGRPNRRRQLRPRGVA